MKLHEIQNQQILGEDRGEGREEVAPEDNTGAASEDAGGEKVAIYALIDPRDGSVRYIGKTNNPKARLRSHLKYPCNEGLRRWLVELREIGLIPIMKIIKWVPMADYSDVERYFISKIGLENLLNVRLGGDGPISGNYTSEIRSKMSTLAKIQTNSKEFKSAISLVAKKTMSRPGAVEAFIARTKSDEVRRKMSQSARARAATPDGRARMARASRISRECSGKEAARRKEAHLFAVRSPKNRELRRSVAILLTATKAWKVAIKKANSRPVFQYSIDGVFISRFASCSDAAAFVGSGRSGVINAASRNGICYGFRWKYADEHP